MKPDYYTAGGLWIETDATEKGRPSRTRFGNHTPAVYSRTQRLPSEIHCMAKVPYRRLIYVMVASFAVKRH